MKNAPGSAAAKGHRRPARSHSGRAREYRVTGTWPPPTGAPATIFTYDRKQARSAAKSLAARGAYVTIARSDGYGGWDEQDVIDAPARAAAAEATAALLAAEQAEADRKAARATRDARRAAARRAADLADAERIMQQPPVGRDSMGRTRAGARHTAGQR